MSYEGTGQYLHYKGGNYYALGIGELESDHLTKFVVYVSYSPEHEAAREDRGVDFILRPQPSNHPIATFVPRFTPTGHQAKFKPPTRRMT
jgi:hypothetical protein